MVFMLPACENTYLKLADRVGTYGATDEFLDRDGHCDGHLHLVTAVNQSADSDCLQLV